MVNSKAWFVIINPTSGYGSSRKKWTGIKQLLTAYGFNFHHAFTEYHKHSVALVHQAIREGIKNFISVGGDGTLHNIVNAIMTQDVVISSEINVGIIPIGTGNDWVKTHHIPSNIEQAIQLIKNGNVAKQDIGKIEFIGQKKSAVYFNNLAGIGFDGYVVSKVHKYKHIGALAYLAGTFVGLFSFKNFHSKTIINSQVVSGKTLMVLIGLCKYSGGGMQLTKTPNPFDGLFDVSIAGNFSKFDIIKNVSKLFNGKIVDVKKVFSFKSPSIIIETHLNDEFPFIQADGELIGTGDIKVVMASKAFSFYSNNEN